MPEYEIKCTVCGWQKVVDTELIVRNSWVSNYGLRFEAKSINPGPIAHEIFEHHELTRSRESEWRGHRPFQIKPVGTNDSFNVRVSDFQIHEDLSFDDARRQAQENARKNGYRM